jgi:hypothetical protein
MTLTFDGCSQATQQDRLREAGVRAYRAAAEIWCRDIIDPSAADLAPPPVGSVARERAHTRAVQSRMEIDSMLNACGWGWATPYKGNRLGPEWCGIFAAKCWREAGLDPALLATWFPSTYRLHAWAHYNPFDDKHPNRKPATGPYRLAVKLTGLKPEQVDAQAGDIVVVGDGSPEHGDHITVLEGFDKTRGLFSTVSGNGGGAGPDGKHREGVVVRDFPLAGTGYRAMWLYRPALSDLV